MIIPLNSLHANLSNSGGKGMNLARLSQADFPVPQGFIIITAAYTEFVNANSLVPFIKNAIDPLNPYNPDKLEASSKRIREKFSAGKIPDQLKTSIKKVYAEINEPAVAVRSSATAEDLPDMSFAGQQDTFLNVIGFEALCESVINCWSSLWTARAIGYRDRNRIPHGDVALAVVVQEMVQSEISGIMFTVNPLNGIRNQIVIDASYGLGEALVGGQVDPDQYIVYRNKHVIISRKTGEKKTAVKSSPDGGVEKIEGSPSADQALSDDQILELADWGEKVERLYNFPQDIEWAVAGGKIFLLQSRPITSLFPVPDENFRDSLHFYFSFASVQGIMEPITPLGQDIIRLLFAGGAELFGYKFTHETQPVIKSAGERLWVDITPIIMSRIGRKILPKFFSAIDPGLVPAITKITAGKRLKPARGGPGISGILRFLKFMIKLQPVVFKNVMNPDKRRDEINIQGDELIALDRAGAEKIHGDDILIKFKRRLELLKGVKESFRMIVPLFGAGAFSGLLPYFFLHRLGKKIIVPDGETPVYDILMELSRGLLHNVTTGMDLVLWETAVSIRNDGPSRKVFDEMDAGNLAGQYLEGKLPAAGMEAIGRFMNEFGMRGPAEIDFGRPRWMEDPGPVMQTLKSYLMITDRDRVPAVMFRKGEDASIVAAEKYIKLLEKTRFGGIKARFAVWAIRRYRAFAGLRESPKFHIIRRMGIFRKALLESGSELVNAGILGSHDDLFYLTLNELDMLSVAGKMKGLELLVKERKDNWNREKLRRQIPRMILSTGETFYEGVGAEDAVAGDGSFRGSPVSPGIAEGRVRVVFSPHDANLLPGEILVCPGTDPSWTPLFMAAGGLVMEVGGMMTHGSIVAREYGIPAVAGVHQATTRLSTGMKVKINGSSGRIEILDPDELE